LHWHSGQNSKIGDMGNCIFSPILNATMSLVAHIAISFRSSIFNLRSSIPIFLLFKPECNGFSWAKFLWQVTDSLAA
jgi:hypothetical protein